ncbi:MAG: glycosyltransferase family protein, partial [Reichenbachiella sp.]
RVGSTRLPGKVMLKINGDSLLSIHLKRLIQVSQADSVIVATTNEEGVQEILNIAKSYNVNSFQGSTNDVLDRFYHAAKKEKADIVVRITSDCPLIDPQLMGDIIEMMISKELDYCTNILEEQFPDGQDIEVMTFDALERAWNEAKLNSDREHVTPYIRKNGSFNGGQLFKTDNYASPRNMNHIRMTVDEKADFDAIVTLLNRLGSDKSWREYAEYVEANENEFTNQKYIRNEGYLKSLKKDISN